MPRTYSENSEPRKVYQADTIRGFTEDEVKAALEKAKLSNYTHPQLITKVLVNAYFDDDNNIDLNDDRLTEVNWILSTDYTFYDVNYYALSFPILRLNLDATQTTTFLTNQMLDLTFLNYTSGIIFQLFSELELQRPNFILNTTVGPISLSLIAENTYYGISYNPASNSILDVIAEWNRVEGRLRLSGHIVPLS